MNAERKDAEPTPLTERKSETLSTLSRGMAVFEHIVVSGPVTAKQIAAWFGISAGVCYHILRTLEADGYVVRQSGGVYELGPHGYGLGRRLQQHSEIAPELAVILTRLFNATAETTFVAEWRSGAVLLRNFLTSNHSVSVGGLEVGYTGDMHARASCKSILAHLPVEQVDTLFAGVRLTSLTRNTIVELDALQVELARVRSQGYAIDNEEFAEGMQCVSAPYFAPEGVPAGSFTVSAPVERFRRNLPQLIERVREAANIASTLLASGRLRPLTPEQEPPADPARTERRSA
ncbi:IclR family transcriptional regulator [Agromyces badenianii]|uniref:IclR family transcriptional regulator n=1 Tax=Agromyces badenianii TaxID=2080742 RepID=UPI000D59BD9B|nr:IclR family transcriptional regulator [Agromyces badenianii]PWC05586.1 IclR family transcriptional regulator [Agromyces badenianii]